MENILIQPAVPSKVGAGERRKIFGRNLEHDAVRDILAISPERIR
jgi:hypothetical protein